MFVSFQLSDEGARDSVKRKEGGLKENKVLKFFPAGWTAFNLSDRLICDSVGLLTLLMFDAFVVYECHCFSLSLSETHTHTHTLSLSLLLSTRTYSHKNANK